MRYLDQNKTRERVFCCAFFFLLCIVLASQPGLSQTANGVIKGTVFDQNQAVVPRAQVTLTNENTNISAKTQTNEAGIYYFGAVQPGPCKVVVELTGFKKWEGKLQLQVGQNAVVDAKLELGNIESTIEVTGASPPITTESAEIAGVKDSQRIEQLPLNGRFISNLFNLTPGVEGAGNPRVNGMKVGSAEMLVDGVSIVDRFGGGMARVQPALDTVQEFRIETVGSNAQYTQPATITLLTKSGTNTLHGSIFETFRNNADGLRARQRQDGDTSAKLIRNEYGVSAGGPIYLGSLYDGRNKSFWFAAFEGRKQRESHFTEDVVPTPAMWGGDFSNLIDNNGNRTHIYDPLTTDANGVRQQFPNDIIPANRINPFFKTMQSLTALPTSNTLPTQGPNFDHFYPANTDANTFTIKGDHKFSDKDSISVRFTRSHQLSQTLGGVYGNPAFNVDNAYGSLRQDVKIYDPSIQHTHVFSPTFLNELLVSGHRSNNSSGTLGDLTDWAGKLGLPNPFGVTGWPTFYASEVNYTYFAFDGDNRNDQQLTSYVVEDNLTWIKGKHSMKFGGRFRQEYNNVRELQQAQGSHDFGPDWTALYDAPNDAALPYTGSGLADMALGLPTTLRNQYNHGYYYFRQKAFGLYFHDNWKVSPRLTLDLGLRWDKWTPYNEKYNRLVNLDLASFANTFQVITPNSVRMEDIPGIPAGVLDSWAARGLTWKTANELGFPGALWAADNNNFGPRLGAAFKITDKTVLRGSYGEFFWPMPLSQILQASRTNPPLNLLYISHFSRLDGTATYGLQHAPNANMFIPDATVDVGAGSLIDPTAAQGMRAFDGPGWKDARSQSWHLTLEREVMRNTALRLSYIGDHGSDLEQVFDINSQVDYSYVLNTGLKPPGVRALERVNPNWNLSGSKNRTGYSNTHSAQVEIERKYSNGLAFQWFYTFTRSRTTTDAGGFTNGGGGGINATDGQNTVPEQIQLLGQPNLSYDQRLRLIYQNSSNIPGHRIRYNGIYDFPFGQGKHFGGGVSKGLDYLIGGWQVAFIGDWRGGFWRSVTANDYLQGDPTLSPDQRLLLTFNGRTQRLWFRGDFLPTNATNVSQDALQALIPVDRAQRVLRPLGPNFNNRVPVQLADGSTILVSLSGTLNPNARAFYQGPGAWNDDISVYKNFKFTERLQARFSADFFNAFNHPNDQDPNATTGLQDLSTQPNDPRIIQFSLRLNW